MAIWLCVCVCCRKWCRILTALTELSTPTRTLNVHKKLASKMCLLTKNSIWSSFILNGVIYIQNFMPLEMCATGYVLRLLCRKSFHKVKSTEFIVYLLGWCHNNIRIPISFFRAWNTVMLLFLQNVFERVPIGFVEKKDLQPICNKAYASYDRLFCMQQIDAKHRFDSCKLVWMDMCE